MTSSETETGPRPFSGELDDLARSHRATWLAEVLPRGPCLVWGGGPALAAVLAADGTRTVLLLLPTEGGVEHAMRRPNPGVRVRRAPALRTGGADKPANPANQHGPPPPTFASAVVVPGPEDDAVVVVAAIADQLPSRGALVVVVAPGVGARVADVLRATGHSSSVHHQAVRAASCIALAGESAATSTLGALQPATTEVDLVLVAVPPRPSVRLGGDASPTRWWRDANELIADLRRLDQEIGTEDVRRIRDLEAAVAVEHAARAAAEHEVAERDRRIDELLSSTSWRISAPARWLSEAVRRR